MHLGRSPKVIRANQVAEGLPNPPCTETIYQAIRASALSVNPEGYRCRGLWDRSGVDPRRSAGSLVAAAQNDALPDVVLWFSEAVAGYRLDSDAPTLEELLMSVDQIPLSTLAVTRLESVRPSDAARRAGELMEEFNFSQVPVIESCDRLHGVVTWRRLSQVHSGWGEIEVSEIVSEIPTDRVRRGETPLGEVFDLLFEYDFVFISDDDGHTMTAIVTINDVARYLYENAD